MLSLTEFLLARIAEDESVARDFIGEGPWQAWAVRDVAGPRRDDEHAQLTVGAARVLAECEAKRRIVELVGPAHDERDEPILGSGLPDVLAALALPYADHEQFQEEWRGAVDAEGLGGDGRQP